MTPKTSTIAPAMSTSQTPNTNPVASTVAPNPSANGQID